jgi:hypothetical protein
LNLTLCYLGPSVGFINPWTGEEIPGIPGEHDDDDSMHGKSAICLKVVFVCVWLCFKFAFIPYLLYIVIIGSVAEPEPQELQLFA